MQASDPDNLRKLRRENAGRDILLQRGWYHSFRLPDGTLFEGLVPLERLEYRWSKFPFPESLRGKRLLDIGAWDGWFSFEAERRGAAVTAIDAMEQSGFRKLHAKLESRAEYRVVDLFDLPRAGLGTFEYVLFLGVVYHTKHPILALEIVCAATTELAIVESYVTDAETWREASIALPTLEFYETDELGGQLDNWFGPTVQCLIAMSRTAGFARVEVLDVGENRAALACYRNWPDEETASGAPVHLDKVANGMRRGINFRSDRDEYLAWYFKSPSGETKVSDLRLQVGPFGVPALQLLPTGEEQRWIATSRLPPGLRAGWHEARMRISGGPWSQAFPIAVDMPAGGERIEIKTICDGRTWERNLVRISADPPVVSLWVTGLAENADEANVEVRVGAEKAHVAFVGGSDGNGERQINAEVPAGQRSVPAEVTVSFGGARSQAVAVDFRE